MAILRRTLALLGVLAAAVSAQVLDERVIQIDGSPTVIKVWREQPDGAGAPVSFYSVSFNGEAARVRSTSYELLLRRARFDPLVALPDFAESPVAVAATELRIVQFHTQPLEVYREQIRALGGTVHNFVANHAYIVRLSAAAADQVRALPFVRWVGDYHPEFRLEEALLAGLRDGGLPAAARYRIQVCERGAKQKQLVAGRLRALGATIDALVPEGFWLEATLTPALLRQVVGYDEVLFVDRWFPPESDMNRVRTLGGADYVESVAGYSGQGVRCEVMDGNVRLTHVDFQGPPLLLHGTAGGDSDHGTKCCGIVFGDGTGDPLSRGMLPDAEQTYFASYGALSSRYAHTAELVAAPYECVLQSNSWGNGLTQSYTSVSAEMDDIIFLNDILICQSQSNDGTQNSRPQAWAKNVVSVGGIKHKNNLDRSDDDWTGGASIGPAADGRLKPDLAYYYDSIRTTDDESDTDYTLTFNGTSSATPMTAGSFGILFQMWADGIFGNTLAAPGGGVFANRPHSTTAKALMIATAYQYDFAGTGHDLTRTHQGWGTPDLANLYDKRDKFFVVDETDVLSNLSSVAYDLHVAPMEPALKVTMVYLDVAGTTSAAQHRINDLTLRVTSPSGAVYWGNANLDISPWSTPGGAGNTRDTVENVFVQMPETGTWHVEIIADEINADGHTETPAVDADFALVVCGAQRVFAGCNLATPFSPAWDEVAVDFTTYSAIAPTIDTLFEYSLDGVTWSMCTPTTASPTGNPGVAQAAGPGLFSWDADADGVAGVVTALGVRVRLQVDDGGAFPSSVCLTSAFDIDRDPPVCPSVPCSDGVCGDCDGDHRVTLIDAYLAARASTGTVAISDPARFEACNVAGELTGPSAELTILDALEIARYVVGLGGINCCDDAKLDRDVDCGGMECGSFQIGGAAGDLADHATTHYFAMPIAVPGRSFTFDLWGTGNMDLFVGDPGTPRGDESLTSYLRSSTGPTAREQIQLDDAAAPFSADSYAGASVVLAVKARTPGTYVIKASCKCKPIDITMTGVHVGDTSLAFDGAAGSCGGAGSPDIPFKYRMQTPGKTLVISTDNPGTSDDTILYAGRGNCPPGFSELACDNDGGTGTTSLIQIPRAAGTYIIFVDSAGGGGPFELTCSEEVICTVEGVVGALPASFAGNITGADDTYAISCAAADGADHVYEFTPPMTTTYSFSLCTGTSYDCALAIWDGDCATGTEVSCRDDSCGQQVEILGLALTAGTTYAIVVDGWNGAVGPYTLDISTP